MKKAFLIFQFLCCMAACFGQQKLQKADKLFNEMAYVAAVKAYESYLESGGKPSTAAILKIADAYFYTQDYDKAAGWYAKYPQLFNDKHFNRYIQSLRVTGNYVQADRLSIEKLASKKDKTVLERFNRQKKYLDSINSRGEIFILTNAATVNTTKADFGTAFYGMQVVYSSAKDTAKTGGKTYTYNNQPFLELYIADRNPADGSLINEKKFIPKDLHSYHNATVAFSPDMHTIYYSSNTVKGSGRLRNSGGGTNNLGIIRAFIEDGHLRDAQPLPFNSLSYSVAHPALTADGNWLFFTSDMPGGYGETDIYVVEVLANGIFGQPKNLGPAINTSGREMFPFINNEVLYFSSDGHYGLGGLDVFESTRLGDYEFAEPKNIGKPINSNLDDFSFIINTEMDYGYVSSNRKGGKGDDDIYYFTHLRECVQTIAGIVTRKDNMPLPGAKLKAISSDGVVLFSAEADTNGKYSFNVPCNTTITVDASKEDYTAEKAEVVINGNPKPRIVNFELTGYNDLIKKEGDEEKIAINPVYFDLDKWDITPQAATELDKVVYMMNSFPAMIIKIESHTDSRASSDYNILLSQNRARATYEYIITQGIDARRIESVNGYGETRLVNNCADGITCTEELHAANRRSDFIVVKR